MIQVNSLSKVVGGGLRIGWIAARGPVLDRLATLKQATDFHTPTLVQHMAARYLATDGYERQLERSLPYYRERRDALMAALERHLAGEYEAAAPRGGHHVWVTLKRPVEERALLLGGRAPRRVVHPRRRRDRRAAAADQPAALVLAGRAGGARGGRQAAGARAARGPAANPHRRRGTALLSGSPLRAGTPTAYRLYQW